MVKQTSVVKSIEYILPFYKATLEAENDFNKLRNIDEILMQQLKDHLGSRHDPSFPPNRQDELHHLDEFIQTTKPRYLNKIYKLMGDNQRVGSDGNETYSVHFFRILEKLLKCYKKKAKFTNETFAPVTTKMTSLNTYCTNDKSYHDLMANRTQMFNYFPIINGLIIVVDLKYFKKDEEQEFIENFNKLVATSNEFWGKWATFEKMVDNVIITFPTVVGLKKEIAVELDRILDDIWKKNAGFLETAFKN